MLKVKILLAIVLCAALVISPCILSSAVDSNYTANVHTMFNANESYIIQDNVNSAIGNSFDMHCLSTVTINGMIWAYYVGYENGHNCVKLAKSTNGINFTDYGTVLTVGDTGSWDDNLATFPGVWYENGTFYLVYEGRSDSAMDGKIGLATSSDGVHFTKYAGNPILNHNSTGWEAGNVGTPSLYKVGSTWYLFYHGYDGDRRCQIGVATGTSLTSLTKHPSNPILPSGPSGSYDEGTLGKRSIIYRDGYYYMVYEASTLPPVANFSLAKWSLALARSTNLINWTKYSQNPILPQTPISFGNDCPEFITINGVDYIYYRSFDNWSNPYNGNCTRRARIGNETNGGYSRIWEAENLNHVIGRADCDGWSASTTLDPANHLVYGPYETNIPVGENIAIFKMMIDNNTADDLAVVRLDVYDSIKGIVASRDITRKQFKSTFHYEFFAVPFRLETPGTQVQFRIWWYDRAYIRVDRVLLTYGKAPRNLVAFKAKANNKYVCAENAGASPLIANRTAIGDWERFRPVDAGSGKTAFIANINGKYVCAENAGASPLIANRTAIGDWEKFTLENLGLGLYALKAYANGKYVCAENAGADPLIANRTSVGGDWEKFQLIYPDY